MVEIYLFIGRVLGRLVCAHRLEEHNRLPGGDLKNVGNFAGECSVLLLPCKEVSISFSFCVLGSPTVRVSFLLATL